MKKLFLYSLLASVAPLFGATSINLSSTTLTTVNGVYTVEGKTITLVKPGETYTFTGNGTTPQWSVKLATDCLVNLTAATLKPASGAALDANGHNLDLTLNNTKSGNTETGSTLVGAFGFAGLQLNAPSKVTIRGAGWLTAQGLGGAASVGSAKNVDAGTLKILSGRVTAIVPGQDGPATVGAAIGSGYCGNGGMISIEGGTVTATGTLWGSAIGAGATYNSSKSVSAGVVRILGGTVTATGGKDGGAAIGGSHGHASNKAYQSGGGTCEILGGTVTLTSGDGDTFATIGGGKIAGPGMNVTIDAAAMVTMTSRGNNNHQFGCRDTSMSQGTLKFTNRTRVGNHRFLFLVGDATNYLADKSGYVKATLADGFAATSDIIFNSSNTDKGMIASYATRNAVQPEVPEGFDAVIDLNTITVGSTPCYTRRADGVIEIAANKKVLVTGQAYYETSADMTLKPLGAFDITLKGANIRGAANNPAIDVNGQQGTLRLVEGTTSTLYGAWPNYAPGISMVTAGGQLTIEGKGALYVRGNGANVAGIGGGNGQSMQGTLIINSGNLTVSSGTCGASGQCGTAIGGGYKGSGGTVIINGGSLTATSGQWGCAIGAGNTYGSTVKVGAGSLTVNGGYLSMTGGKDGGAAFGCGHCENGKDNFTGGTLTINGGTVVAHAGLEGTAGAGVTAIFGGGKYSQHGIDVSIDVAATVEMYSDGTSTPAFGSSGATEANKGSLTFTDKFNTTGVRRFLLADADDPKPSVFTGTMAADLASRVTYLTGPGGRGTAQSWTVNLPSDAEMLDFNLLTTTGTAWTLNNNVYELNGAKTLYLRGTTGRTFKLVNDVNNGVELVLAQVSISPTTVSCIDLNGHALDLRIADGTENRLVFSGSHRAGIRVGPTSTLTIKGASYANASAMGTLRVEGRGRGAGIGGDPNERCGTVYMQGGKVTAVTSGGSGQAGAGIGGGWCAAGPVLFEMTDGWLNAGKEGQHGCGIGAGSSHSGPAGTDVDAGHIVFKGGYTDVGGCTDGGAAIGGGHSTKGNQSGGGVIEFLGGTVIATGAIKDSGAAVIGGGKEGGKGSAVTLDVSAYLEIHRGSTTNRWGIGKSTLNSAEMDAGSITITNAKGITEERVFLRSEICNELASASGATVTNQADGNGYKVAAMFGEARYESVDGSAIDLATAAGDTEYVQVSGSTVTIKKTPVTLYGSGKSVVCAADGEVRLAGATLNGLNTGAHAINLVIEGVNTSSGASGKAGVTVANGGSLTISGTGTLTANGNNGGAGIGGDYNMGMAGNITIESGTVIANAGFQSGGHSGAGIGSGGWGSVGTITINGGKVTVNGQQWAAAIGGGANAGWSGTPVVGKITITGGEVYAKGGPSGGAAIGGGHENSSNFSPAIEVEILGGTVTCDAQAGQSATDFRGAVLGGGRRCTQAKVTISTAATVKTQYVVNGLSQNANLFADIGTPTAGSAGELIIVAAPGSEGRMFLDTSYQDVLNCDRVKLGAGSVGAGDLLVTKSGTHYQYAYSPAGVTWTGAGDGIKWSDPANWSGSLNTISDNGTITFRGNCAAMVNDVGPIAATLLRNVSGGALSLSGAPIVSGGNLSLEGGEFSFAKLWVDGQLVPNQTVKVGGGEIHLGEVRNYPYALEFTSGNVEIDFLVPPNAQGLFIVDDAATVTVHEIECVQTSRYISDIYGTLMFKGMVTMTEPSGLRIGAKLGGTIRVEQGILVGAGSVDILGEGTLVMGGDIMGDTDNFYCMYGTGTGAKFVPMSGDFTFEDTVSVEGNTVVSTSDEDDVPCTVTFERGLQCRAKGTLNSVNINAGQFTLTLKGAGTAVVAPRQVTSGAVAFNQNVAVTDRATLRLMSNATLENGNLSLAANTAFAFDGDAATMPGMSSLTCASGARLLVSGKADWTGASSLALCTATTFTGTLPTAVVNGKERRTMYRDGTLYACGGGLVIILR